MTTSAYSFAAFPTAEDFRATSGCELDEAAKLVQVIEALHPDKGEAACTLATMAAFAINESILNWRDVWKAIAYGVPISKWTWESDQP